MKKRLILAGIILIVGITAIVIYRFNTVRNGDALMLSGNIEVTEVKAGFKIPGRVHALFAEEGQRVAKGEKIAVLDSAELYGLVGPDGAGKTTTMRLLTAIMDPTAGDEWVAGHSLLTEGELIKEKIGYLSQRFGLYEDLTVIENILFYADL